MAAQIHTRVTLIEKNGDPKTLQLYEAYVWLPRGSKVKHENQEYVVDEYRMNITKNIMDLIVIPCL